MVSLSVLALWHYQLKLPDSIMMTAHDVFHVCCLKACRDNGRMKSPPVSEMVGDEPESEVDRVFAGRLSHCNV